MNLFIFTHGHNQNSPPGFYNHHSRQKEIPYFTQLTFFENLFFLSRKGEDYGAEKMTKIKRASLLIMGFDKFHHCCNLYIFGFCFIAQ